MFYLMIVVSLLTIVIMLVVDLLTIIWSKKKLSNTVIDNDLYVNYVASQNNKMKQIENAFKR